MKKLLPLLLVFALSGCRTETLPQEPTETQPEEMDTVQTEPPAPDMEAATAIEVTLPEIEPPTEEETLSAAACYRAHLEELLEKGAAEDDQFAVYDIDGDGRDELIVIYTDDEGTAEYIMEGEGTEFRSFAGAVFYRNGAVSVSIPLDGEETEAFVPYVLYQYDAELDAYYEAAYVDRLVLAELEAEGIADEYPEDADTSESGVVYLIGSNPVDSTEYALWCSSWQDEDGMLEIPFVPLTKEQAEAVG